MSAEDRPADHDSWMWSALYQELEELVGRIEHSLSRALISAGEPVAAPGEGPRPLHPGELSLTPLPDPVADGTAFDLSMWTRLLDLPAPGAVGHPGPVRPEDVLSMLKRIRGLREAYLYTGNYQLGLVLGFLEQLVRRISVATDEGAARPADPARRSRPGPATAAPRINLLLPTGYQRQPPAMSPAPEPEGLVTVPHRPPTLPREDLRSWWPDAPSLRRWVSCFKNRLAVPLYLNHMLEPGWPEMDEAQARGHLEAARKIQEALTKVPDGKVSPIEHLARRFEVPDDHALVLFYLLLSDVGDWELPTRGSALLAATGFEGSLDEALAPFAPGSPLVEKGLIRVARAGRTAFSSTYRLSQDALERVIGSFTGPKFYDRLPGGEREQLGELRQPRVELSDVIVPDSTYEQLLDALVLAEPRGRSLVGSPELSSLFYKAKGTVFLFEGPPGTGKTMAAEGIAHHLGQPLYIARYDRIIDMWMGELEKNVSRLFGEASEAGAILLLDEADALLSARGSSHLSADKARNTAVNLLLGLLEEFDGIVILTTNLAAKLDAAVERRLTARVRFDLPGPREREEIWRRHLAETVPVRGELDYRWLARRFVLTGARIRSAVLSALRKALRRRLGLISRQPAAGHPPATGVAEVEAAGTRLAVEAADVIEAAREQARGSFRDRPTPTGAEDTVEAGTLRTPGFDLGRVVLPEGHRRAIREALVMLDPAARRLFESESFMDKFQTGRGIVFLFEGPSGTGKTMTAEAIAAELGRALYQVRLERLISMWVGQSEKGLSRAFDEAQAHEAVLLFDEADLLLAERSGPVIGDRVGSNLLSVLLNLLEESAGVVVFTTNRDCGVDRALARRLTTRLTFPLPDLESRVRILAQHIPQDVELAADANLEDLARRYPVSGGRIRNVVLTAIRGMIAEDPANRVLSFRHLEQAFREARDEGTKPMGFRLEVPAPQTV